jgi:hypothetical protein
MSWPTPLFASERALRRVVRDCVVEGRGAIVARAAERVWSMYATAL